MPIPFARSLWFLTVEGDLLRLSPHEEHPESVCTFGGEKFGARPLLTRNLGNPSKPDALVAHNDTGVYLADLDSGKTDTLYESTGDTILLSDWASPYTSVAQDGGSYYVLGQQDGTAVLVAISRTSKRPMFHRLEGSAVAAGPVVFNGAVLAFGRELVYCLRDDKVLACRWPTGFVPCVSAEEINLSLCPAVGQWPYAVTDGSGVYMLGVFEGAQCAQGFVLVSNYKDNGMPHPTSIRLEPPRNGGDNGGGNRRGLVAQYGDGPVLIARDEALVRLDGTSSMFLCRAEVSDDSAPFYDGKSFAFTADRAGSGKRLLAGNGSGQLAEAPLSNYADHRDGMGFAVCAERLVHVYADPGGKARFLVW